MFCINPRSVTPSSVTPWSVPALDYHFDAFLAQQRAEQRARAEANVRRYQEQHIRNALRAQEINEYVNSALYDCDYGYPTHNYSALDYAIDQARRQATLERVLREREARHQKYKRLAALKVQREEQELGARRRADAARFLGLLLDPQHEAQIEIPTRPKSSTPNVPVQGEPSLKDRLEERLMNEYESDVRDALQSLLSSVCGGHSSEAPGEPLGVPSASAPTNPSVSVQGKEEGIASQDKGKGKDKELPLSDSEEESSAQIASSLFQITSIASRLETLLANFQFPAELHFSPERSLSPSYSALDTHDEFALTYTPTNAPLRAQEHALLLLLSELDNVPSFGSRVVKDARRTVVARVEEALEELEKGVEERRGRARARKADPVSVESVRVPIVLESTSLNVEQTAHPMDVDIDASPSELESADLIPVDDVTSEVSVSFDIPMDTSAAGSVNVPVEALASETIDPTVLASSEISIEAPGSIPISNGLASASMTEPSVASSASVIFPPTSLPMTPSEAVVTARVSIPQDELSMDTEELFRDLVSTASQEAPGEDMAVMEQAEIANTPMPSAHTYPAEVINTIDKPASYSPAASSSLTSADEEQNVATMESPTHASPISEAEVDTFLLPASRPASPRFVARNSEDEDGVVVDYEHETEHTKEDEDGWSDVEA
ncbi:hypothetical protein K503DRAFT_852392 [Rhizopogon vinicolor AM-OR11-026]|uniref:BAG domain-containing protein n=1 Tax=Rhizopogon vinicolor AM-OR11-026 TaxID=1314800 RepID=A0A1B7NJ59_9AGAM|nr:hypothetical protein K503DRAFT_852392 [Rhizopogon vinicolor AM-OR11-026]